MLLGVDSGDGEEEEVGSIPVHKLRKNKLEAAYILLLQAKHRIKNYRAQNLLGIKMTQIYKECAYVDKLGPAKPD